MREAHTAESFHKGVKKKPLRKKKATVVDCSQKKSSADRSFYYNDRKRPF